jgi:beta-D-xylosidase 4
VLVLIHGGPLALDDTSLSLPAIVDAHYPGEMGGDAVVSVLFGDVSPSGRLTTTVYPAEFVQQRDMSDYQLAPHTNAANASVPGITYLYYDGTPQFPFGFGLSYTTFAFAWLSEQPAQSQHDAAALASGVLPPFAVNVTNTGGVTSDVSALAFVSTGVPGEPLKQLFDFQRAAAVAPGDSVVLSFTLPPELAAVVLADGSRVIRPGTTLRVTIGDVPAATVPWSDAVARGSIVRTDVVVGGEADVVVSSLPPRKQTEQ